MQRKYRLTQNASFNYIYRKGTSCSTPRIIVYKVAANSLKVGVSVSTKVGNSVVRSRVKRRVSERFRLLIPRIAKGNNFVITAREPAANATSAEFERDLIYTLGRLGVLGG